MKSIKEWNHKEIKEFLYQKIENINTKNFKYFERSCNRTN